MAARKVVAMGLDGNVDMPDLSELLEQMQAVSPVSRSDLAIARLASTGLPNLIDVATSDQLLAALSALDPSLRLADLDDACSKLEDLAILLLGQARNARHEVEDLVSAHGESTLVGKVLGAEALGIIDDLSADGALDAQEADTNRTLIQSLGAAGTKRQAKAARKAS